MPLLDVSFMVEDPMLADTFDVRRRLDVVGQNGRVTAGNDQLYKNQLGVVTHQDPSTLVRAEDGQSVPKRILIVSRFSFIAQAQGKQPDEVLWNNCIYTVESSLPYSRYGAGFYEAVAEFRGATPPQQ